jgi:hypothetical protein
VPGDEKAKDGDSDDDDDRDDDGDGEVIVSGDSKHDCSFVRMAGILQAQ